MTQAQLRPQRIRVHFFGRQPGRAVSPLAGALGIGPFSRPTGIGAQRFERLERTAAGVFEVVGAESSDLWLYAHDLSGPSELHQQLDRLDAHTPRCVFFYSNDDASPMFVTRPDVTVFRTSLFARTRLAHESAMPALCDDLLEECAGGLVNRTWSEVPTVGFCGFVGSPIVRLGLQALLQLQKRDGLAIRERALTALERSTEVRTRFVRRVSFWGGSMSRFHLDAARQAQVRDEFLKNVIDTDYTLCARGKGNFSYRFYEVLSAGRIPVFVNSDCVLPFEGRIDWKRHVVWLEADDLGTAAKRVAEFHRALGPAGFLALQSANRALWQEWLSPEAFFGRALGPVPDTLKAAGLPAAGDER